MKKNSTDAKQGVKKDVSLTQDVSLTSLEHLEAILFQFVNLYERWSEDRQVMAKHSADLAQFVKILTQQVRQFATLEDRVREDIHTSIRTEAKNIAVSLGQTIGDAARQEIAPMVKQLEGASNEARRHLIYHSSEWVRYQWVMIGVVVLTTVITSLLIVACLIPAPVLPLTAKQMDTYEAGESFKLIWPQLSDRQKQWLLDIEKGNGKNDEPWAQDNFMKN